MFNLIYYNINYITIEKLVFIVLSVYNLVFFLLTGKVMISSMVAVRSLSLEKNPRGLD